MHTLNIYIARSNLVSLSNLDAHLMGQVQVRNEDIFPWWFRVEHFISPLLLLLSLFLTRLECYSSFSFFSGGCSAVLQPHFMDSE